ncbi:hypothetical protein Tco_0215306 [Tanacetum coccineum]
MCCEPLPPPLCSPSAKLMIITLLEYWYQRRRGIRIVENMLDNGIQTWAPTYDLTKAVIRFPESGIGLDTHADDIRAYSNVLTLKDGKAFVYYTEIQSDQARDIQAWEYVPLGPYLGKCFGEPFDGKITTAAPDLNGSQNYPVLPHLYLTEQDSIKHARIGLSGDLIMKLRDNAYDDTKTNDAVDHITRFL